MSEPPAHNDLVFVTLSDEQIALAKRANGSRKKITHALLCGTYGQMFGTEKQCAKYYNVWSDIFRRLFDHVYDTEVYPIKCFESTFNLVMLLIEKDDRDARH